MAKSRRRRTRRNPAFLNPAVGGVELEDAGAALAGAWGTKNLANIVAPIAAPLTAPINSIRTGLGAAALELGSALLIGRAARMLKPSFGRWATFGGVLVAGNDGINAVTGNWNLIGGTPTLSLPFPAAPAAKAVNGNGHKALPAPLGAALNGAALGARPMGI